MDFIFGKDATLAQMLLYFSGGALIWYTGRLLRQIDGNQAKMTERLEKIETQFLKLLTEHNILCNQNHKKGE